MKKFAGGTLSRVGEGAGFASMTQSDRHVLYCEFQQRIKILINGILFFGLNRYYVFILYTLFFLI